MPNRTLDRPLSALDAIFTRRSVRDYLPDHIDKSTVRGLLDAAVQAPTAIHAQPWLFAVVQGSAVLRRLSERAKEEWRRAETAQEHPLAAAVGVHRDFTQLLADPTFNVFHNAGTLIVICARQTDRFVAADCWLAAENLMLAAAALGLGSCCIGSAIPALNSPEGKKDLGIPADVTAFAPIIVGVPAGDAGLVSRNEPVVISWR